MNDEIYNVLGPKDSVLTTGQLFLRLAYSLNTMQAQI